MKSIASVLLIFLCLPAIATEWAGHVATLADARVACLDTTSRACEPYSAEAVAVADVFNAQAQTMQQKDQKPEFRVVFNGGHEEHCTVNWLRSMNGLSLLHTALALVTDDSDTYYWTQALMKAAQQLCHS